MRQKQQSPKRARNPNRGVLALVSECAVNALAKVDGRASGLKFNKLVSQIHHDFELGHQPAFKFSLPRRWYLYGEIVDAGQVWDIVRFHWQADSDNDFGTTVEMVPGRRGPIPDGLREELEVTTMTFAKAYRGAKGIDSMLRAHYERAPLPFQRAFLEWNLLTKGVLDGRTQDNPDAILRALARLEGEYPSSLDARLTTAFNRLTLYLGPHVEARRMGAWVELEREQRAIWDFWEIFCKFLTANYNADLPPDQVDYLRAHAEDELVAYQRRLVAFLETAYLEGPPSGTFGESPTVAVANMLAEEIHRALTDGY
jgi:hypothetical protein